MKTLSIAAILAVLSAAPVQAQNVQLTDCSLLGPVYPLPADLSSSKAIQTAQKTFSSLLAQAVQNGTTAWGPFDSVNTSISVAVFSTQSQKLLAEFHHVGAAPGSKTHLTGGKLDGDTLYRTGSVAKLLSVYTFLTKLGTTYWSEPVTKYIPELAHVPIDNSVRKINWSEITLGALAGQMSGLPRDCKFEATEAASDLFHVDEETDNSSDALGDLSSMPGLAALGLPELNASEATTCGTIGLPACSREGTQRSSRANHDTMLTNCQNPYD
jgi:CubicO group peptidase (beta-lactamase class C family)